MDWTGTSRVTYRVGVLVLVLLATVAVMPAQAGAAPPPGGHGDADAQASKQHPHTGPARPGLAWSHSLGVDLRNEPSDAILTPGGLVLVQGRATSNVPGSGADESDTPRGYLNAVRAADGVVAWPAPAMDVAHGCVPVATSDGRIIVHVNPKTAANPAAFDANLVALDAATGQLLAGQRYDGEASGDTRLHPCSTRLLLTPDEELVLLRESQGTEFRAVDISAQPWTQAWVHLPTDDNAAEAPVLQQPVLSPDGATLYYVYRKDRLADPDVWGVRSLDARTGEERDAIAIPGSIQVGATERILATEQGIVVAMDDCGAAGRGTDSCLLRIDGSDDLALTWRVDFPAGRPDPALPTRMTSLARLDTDRIVGWADGSIHAFALADGAPSWWHRASSFTNNGAQLVTDVDGNIYYGTFGGHFIESLTSEGMLRWDLPICHVETAAASPSDPKVIGPIAPDGTLYVASDGSAQDTEHLFGFRVDADLPKSTCPEQEERISGATRVETATEVSQVSFPQQDSADTVVLATSVNYPDALAGGPLARRLDAPLLLTAPNALDALTRAEIERLGADTAVLLGGVAALSAAVESELRSMGLTIDRIAGATRFETAARIADRLPSNAVYVTEGANADPSRGWPDAVAVSGLASFEQRPILLVVRDAVPEATAAAMVRLDVDEAVVVGGEAAVSAATAASLRDPDGDGTPQVRVSRESGPSRFATSVAVANRSVAAGASTFDLWFATGLAFPDALAAGPAVARSGGVLLLVHGQAPEGGTEVLTWLEGLDDDDVLRLWFVGGTGAISDAVATRLAQAAGVR